jgi:hypothetical protein
MCDCFVSSREQIDAQVAKQLAEKIEREELEKRQAIEVEDQEIARKLQVSMVLTKTTLCLERCEQVKDTVFKDVMCSFVERYQCLRRTCHLHLHLSSFRCVCKVISGDVSMHPAVLHRTQLSLERFFIWDFY